MPALLLAAFVMGMLGSFHCIGMCGPLALSLPLQKDDFWSKMVGSLLYNAGRIITYSFFGLILGIIGNSVALFGYQQMLSVTLGAFILVMVLSPRKFSAWERNDLVISFFQRIRAAIGRLFASRSRSALLSIGLLNGLLPCGLVYMALAGAVAAGSILHAIVFMVFFGLGTLPVMWSIAFFGNFVSISMRQRIRRAYPLMMILLASLLILRGLGLGIPYLSPVISPNGSLAQHCAA